MILFSNVKFQDGHEESIVKCELSGEDLQGSFHKTVTIDGMTTDWAEANGIESGVTTYFATDAIIDEAEYKLETPVDGAIEVGCLKICISNHNQSHPNLEAR